VGRPATAPRRRDEPDRWTAGRVALVLALVAGLAVVAFLALSRDRRLSGTNDVKPALAVATLAEGGPEVCQPGQLVPAGTAAVAVLATPAARRPVGPLVAELRSATDVVATGRSAGGHRGGWLAVPLDRPVRAPLEASVCVREVAGAPALVSGVATVPATAARAADRRLPGALSLRYLRPGRESWVEVAPVVAVRAEIATASPLGSATPWAVGALVVLLWAGSLALVSRRVG
jgi:hypothetical protein